MIVAKISQSKLRDTVDTASLIINRQVTTGCEFLKDKLQETRIYAWNHSLPGHKICQNMSEAGPRIEVEP
jgi:hypothetical protein